MTAKLLSLISSFAEEVPAYQEFNQPNCKNRDFIPFENLHQSNFFFQSLAEYFSFEIKDCG